MRRVVPLLTLIILPYVFCTTDSARKKLSSYLGTRGCNLNLCFALDGSRGVKPHEYILQKHFIYDVLASIAGNKLEMSGVQYGGKIVSISEMTNDTSGFIVSLDESEYHGGIGGMGRGVKWCHEELKKRYGEAGKIVLLGGAYGGSLGGKVEKVRKDGFDICAVGVGNKISKDLLSVGGGSLLSVDDFFELADVVDEAVEMVCGEGLLR